MSLKSVPIPPVPEEPTRVAHAVFPQGNVLMQVRDMLGSIYTDEQFADLVPTHGQPAEAPWRLVTTELETQAFWLTIDRWLEKPLAESGVHPIASLHAAEHAMIALLPLCVLCIYDGYHGGVGYGRQAYQQFFRLAAATLDHLKRCPCLSGCPACVQSPRCGSGNDELDKKGAVMLLQALLTGEGGKNGSGISL